MFRRAGVRATRGSRLSLLKLKPWVERFGCGIRLQMREWSLVGDEIRSNQSVWCIHMKNTSWRGGIPMSSKKLDTSRVMS
jgi:hypothetical protein